MSKKRYIDIHNHLFPLIDDGPEEIEETLLALQKLVDYGFHQIVFTPHINPSFQEEIKNSISSSIHNFSSEIEKIPIKFHISAEYLFEPGIFRVVEEEKIITISSTSRSFLVEMWVPLVDEGLRIFMGKCLSKNYIPIIAHPERNHSVERIRKMKELGYKIQVNIGSLFGLYGKEIRKNAVALLENDLADCIGTDAHDYGFVKKLEFQMKILEEEIGEKNFRKLLVDSPMALLI